MLREQRLHRRPPRIYGKAQAGIYRKLMGFVVQLPRLLRRAIAYGTPTTTSPGGGGGPRQRGGRGDSGAAIAASLSPHPALPPAVRPFPSRGGWPNAIALC